MPTELPTGLTDEYAEQWDGRWKTYLKREHMHAAPNDLHLLIRDLREFLIPLTVSSDAASFGSASRLWTTSES